MPCVQIAPHNLLVHHQCSQRSCYALLELPDSTVDLIATQLQQLDPQGARAVCRIWRSAIDPTVTSLHVAPNDLARALKTFSRASDVEVLLPAVKPPVEGQPQQPQLMTSLYAALISANAWAGRVQHLSICGASDIAAAVLGFAVAAEGSKWTSIRHLELVETSLTPDTLDDLRDHLPHLERLALDRQWDWRDQQLLLQHPFTSLKALELRGGGRMLELPVAGFAPNLERLLLSGMELHAQPLAGLQTLKVREGVLCLTPANSSCCEVAHSCGRRCSCMD